MVFAAGGTLSVPNSFTSIADGPATLVITAALIEGHPSVAWPKPLRSLAFGAVVFATGAL